MKVTLNMDPKYNKPHLQPEEHFGFRCHSEINYLLMWILLDSDMFLLNPTLGDKGAKEETNLRNDPV